MNKKLREKAKDRYRIDYKGIFLNTAVSLLSSVSATAVTSFLTTIPAGQLPAVAAGIFVAQVLPKMVIELHKSYFRNKARREGYKQGFKDGDDDWRAAKSSTADHIISMCESMSYY